MTPTAQAARILAIGFSVATARLEAARRGPEVLTAYDRLCEPGAALAALQEALPPGSVVPIGAPYPGAYVTLPGRGRVMVPGRELYMALDVALNQPAQLWTHLRSRSLGGA